MKFDVSLVTPEGPAFEGEAEMLVVPGAAGDIFLPQSLQGIDRAELIASRKHFDELFSEESSLLGLIEEQKPEVIRVQVGKDINLNELIREGAMAEMPQVPHLVFQGRELVLEAAPGLWVWALPEITGEDPVPASDRGNIRKMSAAWVKWGQQKGIR